MKPLILYQYDTALSNIILIVDNRKVRYRDRDNDMSSFDASCLPSLRPDIYIRLNDKVVI